MGPCQHALGKERFIVQAKFSSTWVWRTNGAGAADNRKVPEKQSVISREEGNLGWLQHLLGYRICHQSTFGTSYLDRKIQEMHSKKQYNLQSCVDSTTVGELWHPGEPLQAILQQVAAPLENWDAGVNIPSSVLGLPATWRGLKFCQDHKSSSGYNSPG